MKEQKKNLSDLRIDNSWTLFLDRDGVINRKLVDDYVKRWDEFEFLPGVLNALRKANVIFDRIVIVTNQRGIARQRMTVEDLQLVHSKMLAEIEKNAGRIDKVYFCPDGDDAESGCRKPAVGMAQQAKKDFPDINFSKAIMVGDNISDMQFGKRSGMHTVLIADTDNVDNASLTDWTFKSLPEFVDVL